MDIHNYIVIGAFIYFIVGQLMFLWHDKLVGKDLRFNDNFRRGLVIAYMMIWPIFLIIFTWHAIKFVRNK